MATRRPFVGGNWKMNLDGRAAVALAEAVAAGIPDHVDVAVFPPSLYLFQVAAVIRDRPVQLGAQNFYCERRGAFTGELSPSMLQDVGVRIVLAGHSERRHVIGETDDLVNRKVRAAIDAGLNVVLCMGETDAQRQGGRTDATNAAQIRTGLAGVAPDRMSLVTIAYEPVWAIGTGKTATPGDARAAHGSIREVLSQIFGPVIAEATRILYGGSVSPSNAAELFAQDDVDGGLIGGASLKAEEFLAIAHATMGVVEPH